VIGAGVTIGVVAQPNKPDFDGTAGGIDVDP
jgi:hypothetical protein